MATREAVPSAWGPIAWSLVAHVLLLMLLGVNLSLWSSTADQPVRLAIEAAVVVDMEPVQERERAADQRRRDEAERRRAEEARRLQAEREAELARQREAEARRVAEEAKRVEAERIAVEARRVEEERQREAEKARQAEAARRAEEQRQAELKQQREAEAQRAAEEAKRLEAERLAAEKQRAEEARQQAEREALLQAQLDAEQARADAVSAGLQQQWMEVIRQHVQRQWTPPASPRLRHERAVRLVQIPGGEGVNVQAGRCNGVISVRGSIENAVYKASPLPPPPTAALFERNITLVFKPTDY